ncbi:ImmA/IrrE family metallo-endopeptidase [Aureimonas populi]|uniref:ImmA/IrrE family metallo-endopeptidase n=1 Tax=Aureimonas populi TaxID=1701758 RepID=A0ABW5CK81_9HYPH|nr:hypothetical protein [Aureimonas populi]
MQHSIEWQEGAINASPEERATVADLRLFLNNQNVTKYLLDDKLGDHVTIALYGLVEGLVHRWWSIFGARDREFFLKNYRMGYLLPDVRIQFDGAVFEVSSHQCVYTNPDLRFWGGASEVLSRKDGEVWLSTFVEEVLTRLDSQGVRETGAALRWKRVKASRHSQESAFCEAAGSLGLDPYQIADDMADFIEKAEDLFTAEPLTEFVSGAKEVDQHRLIEWASRMIGPKGSNHRLANLRPIVEKIAKEVPARPGEQAWAAGYRRARAMRKALDLKQHSRLASFRDLASRLGAPTSYNLAPKVNGINALRREGPNGIHIHVRNHGNYEGAKTSHLFTLARAIGDAACFPDPEASPINRLRNAYRQAAGRAFAAEFLAPIDEVRSMLEDEYDEYSIANEFGVSPNVIEHQIENEDRIQKACD